jgi:hypothetical protein
MKGVQRINPLARGWAGVRPRFFGNVGGSRAAKVLDGPGRSLGALKAEILK